jgi:predicted ABC-type ATPase
VNYPKQRQSFFVTVFSLPKLNDPPLYIVTGSNGAGKSTVGPDYIPVSLRHSIFDGDKLFVQKRNEFWASGIRAPKECRKLAAEFVSDTFDNLVTTALGTHTSFAYEGHFTNDETWTIPIQFKERGYGIHLFFFGLTNTALSETRVVTRSKEGGHYVDPFTIAENFYGNLEKLDKYFHHFDSVTLMDTSGVEHTGLAILLHGQCISAIPSAEMPDWITRFLPRITETISLQEQKKQS